MSTVDSHIHTLFLPHHHHHHHLHCVCQDVCVCDSGPIIILSLHAPSHTRIHIQWGYWCLKSRPNEWKSVCLCLCVCVCVCQWDESERILKIWQYLLIVIKGCSAKGRRGGGRERAQVSHYFNINIFPTSLFQHAPSQATLLISHTHLSLSFSIWLSLSASFSLSLSLSGRKRVLT